MSIGDWGLQQLEKSYFGTICGESLEYFNDQFLKDVAKNRISRIESSEYRYYGFTEEDLVQESDRAVLFFLNCFSLLRRPHSKFDPFYNRRYLERIKDNKISFRKYLNKELSDSATLEFLKHYCTENMTSRKQKDDSAWKEQHFRKFIEGIQAVPL